MTQHITNTFTTQTTQIFEQLRINKKYLPKFLSEEMEPADFLVLSESEQKLFLPPKGPRLRLIHHLMRYFKNDSRVQSYVEQCMSKESTNDSTTDLVNGCNSCEDSSSSHSSSSNSI